MQKLQNRKCADPSRRKTPRWAGRVFFALVLIPIASYATENRLSASKLPTGPVLTPHSALRAAQGELLVFIEDPPRRVVPIVWQSEAAGEISFATAEGGCHYFFTVSQRQISAATDFAKAGILAVTASNPAANNAQAVVWTAWRPSPADRDESREAFGFSLDTDRNAQIQGLPNPFSWNPQAVWYFQQDAFMNNGETIYRIQCAPPWKRETWARRPTLPYNDLVPGNIIGYARFNVSLKSGVSSAFQICVPFQPLPMQE
ncbi:MAG: hypothetical protein AB1656_06030 [Candidatus Omnitrophota bacterium]